MWIAFCGYQVEKLRGENGGSGGRSNLERSILCVGELELQRDLKGNGIYNDIFVFFPR